MSAQININPLLTTTAAGSFDALSVGLVQGEYMDDPAVRFALSGGVLSTSETLPMWGGVGIFENVPHNGYNPSYGSAPLGSVVGRATAIASLTGFSVFNQSHAMITTPQSPVPTAPSGGQVNFFRLGSGARISVAANPTLVSLEGGLTTQQVSWDFDLQQLTPYTAVITPTAVSALSWAAGVATATVSSTSALSTGMNLVIAGANQAGYNGDQQITVVDSTHFSYPISDPGTTPATGTITYASAGGGALSCKVLRFLPSNAMTVSYDPTTGFASWNRNGSAALIQI